MSHSTKLFTMTRTYRCVDHVNTLLSVLRGSNVVDRDVDYAFCPDPDATTVSNVHVLEARARGVADVDN